MDNRRREEGEKERRQIKRKEKGGPTVNMCCAPSAMRSCNMRNIKERVEERRERGERERETG
jgi:hypothetical protein